MIIDTLRQARAAMATETRIREDKASNEKFNQQVSNLSAEADKLCALVEVVSAIRHESIIDKVFPTEDLQDLMTNINICGEKLNEYSLTESDVKSFCATVALFRTTAETRWREYATSYSQDVSNTLTSLSGLLPNEPKTQMTLMSLNGLRKQLPKNPSSVKSFTEAVSRAQQMIVELNLDPDISVFVTKIRNGQATLTDLNDHRMQWLKDNHLTGRIKIRF